MKKLIALPGLMACGLSAVSAASPEKPNIIIMYIDDMGYSDPSCYGGTYAPTPNIDKLAQEGIRFTQYYTACPISSPSRAGITTGMYPTRWGITTFLDTRAANAKNESNDFLNDRAPSMARALKANGYATGHFGKWHMGGGRDVTNAPSISNYGFDEYVSTYESPDPDPKLTSTNWIWANTDEVKRWDRTAYFVDKTLDFLSRNKDGKPCFINFWPDDVHTPWVCENDGSLGQESPEAFSVVLAELDVQIGRLMQGLKDLGIDEETLVIFTSDNGPAPAFSGNRTDDLRGQKATLYEGGIRMPFIVRWPGTVEPGQTNAASVLCSVDLLPSLCAITGATVPTEFPVDGKDMSEVLLGNAQTERSTPLFWEFGKNVANQVSPHIAVRDGNWKLLVNADGSRVELYDMETDFLEKTNVASSNPEVVSRLKPMAINWFQASFREFADNIIRVAVNGDADKDGSSWENATTLANAITLSAQVSGAQIWLEAGIYPVTASINFDNLAIYGGFAGTEQRLYERDWYLNPAILDGGGTVSPLRNNDLSGTVNSVLDGVTVQNGVNPSGANGGGMIIGNGAVIRNCIFRNNRTTGTNGAALHCNNGSATIENCLFVNNTSLGNGGAMQVGGGTSAIVVNCTFSNNKSTRPGGAFGLGTNTSNLTVVNTIACNNLYGDVYNSYGQNDNINNGGTVISKHSAIESASTKFTDGDDVEHVTLTREITPDFVAPATIIGYTADATEIEQIEAASYQLAEGSRCIDAGNASLAQNLSLDLNGQRRISGNQIDMGAYEFDNGLPSDNVRFIRVAVDGDADKDGSSWENATTLARAVTLSNSLLSKSQIWLEAGTYPVTASINFDNLAIYGGFAGTEELADERNWNLNPSVLDGGGAISPLRNNSLEGTVSSILDGVIIQNGFNQADANGNGNGGGMILANGAVVRNCIFRNNRTQNGKNGAALHCHLGNITIENCLFVNNTSSGNGGAMQVGGNANASVTNCTFANNKSTGPGGAFGLGNNTSNLTILNSIAFNNLYGDIYNSYGQNTNINDGGTVISKHSAIESESTKFTDGDDVAHVVLTREITPDFVAPATIVGYTAGEIAQIEAASYQLAEGSRCIDAGNNNYAAEISLDLAGKNRVQGLQIDMGAYEFETATSISGTVPGKGTISLQLKEGKIQIEGAKKNDNLMIYNINGMLIYRTKIASGRQLIPWSSKGSYLVKIENQGFKLIVQ
ncbi:MAG: sulfatase-like hydrolase/transferase [Dysgonamonadaceae bacterium]|jgi:arylsulfatase A-like enzyme|nr:sulfatase-like hydrolase/transferase [Dysgonamonadaceae bacterium]